MRKFLLTFWLLSGSLLSFSQSPHGEDFKMNCAACHNNDSWEIHPETWGFKEPEPPKRSNMTGWELPADTSKFNHYNTDFPLLGKHATTDCRQCHETLEFSKEKGLTECIDCHTDIHRMTVGSDCARCHTQDNWLIDDVTQLHADNGFPLIGVHAAANCTECHISESELEFPRIGNDCVSCHLDDFNQTTNPNHTEANFSTNCIECHTIDDTDWNTDTEIEHDFFPLTLGHDIEDCVACHMGGMFEDTPTECVACHQTDFDNSLNPNHQAADFSTDCVSCHTTDVGWQPAEFADHDPIFPIYSGAHDGHWTECMDCHQNQSNYAEFTCVACHINPETDEGHTTVSGYAYENTACLACHPTGNVDDSFDHDDTNFPLTGAHIGVDCILCHTDGYAGTPTDCAACHGTDFDETTNPNHGALGLSNDCATCHTTEPDWMPATFANHDDFWELKGAHAAIANDCVACHNGDYNNTPTDCFGCHELDFNQSTNPNHLDAQFPTDCTTCHDETAWSPSSFNHDDHWVLDGAHAIVADDCVACHNGDYTNTPTDCAGCHQLDFDQTVNPNHTALDLSTDCATCHSTDPEWMPAAFPNHDDYWALNGAHAAISNDCAACHNGDYNNTPTDCFGCHADDFNATTDPNHVDAQFTTDCIMCHTESEWVPSTFDHDGQYFPIYSGAHAGEWDDCLACHPNPSNYAEFTCISCHTNPDTDDEHQGVNGYVYEDNACLACHPTGDVSTIFNHDDTNFPLTGAHITVTCTECHTNGYAGTPTDCAACHTIDFNNTTNPNHGALGLSNDCVTCHTTDPGWSPASFDIHDDFYALNGAHAVISNDCAACHNGDYNNTPNTCVGCHTADFNATTDPDHEAAQFPVDCESCHSESAWTPSSFNHDNHWILDGAHATIANDCVACHAGDYQNTPTDCAGCHTDDFNATTNPNHQNLGLSTDCATCHTTQPDWSPAAFPNHDDFYPLNGAHALIANDCAACHNGDYNNTPTDCFGCHQQDFTNTTDPDHVQLQFSTDCASCHSESEWIPSTFDHDGMYFPIYSGAHQGEWDDCLACHPNPSNYAEFTCISCHTNPDTDDEHQGVNGYVYEDNACLACHPTGSADDNFNHDDTNFPLTGAHIGTDCIECHSNGFAGTPTDCASCHQVDFDQTTNPNHNALGLSTDCVSCHTTEAGWNPAEFPEHDDYWALNGAHASISNDCAACHNGDFNNTPNDCAGCHTDDFNATTDPDHEAAQFPIDCESCHTESAWIPSTFDHNEFYELTSAHATIADDCVACHQGDYQNTPNTCEGCHQQDFDQTTNPNHPILNLATDCQTCHTTEPDWMPAEFPNHDDYWQLNGAHAAIANDCVACHNGDYNNTPNDCFGCHEENYNETTNPDHVALMFSTDCASCHTESEWVPSTFDHDGQYFPIYSGEHEGEWDACTDCHTNPSNYAEFTCITCHTNPETDDEHQGVNGYVYESTACLACHPTGDADNIFDHNTTNFPLTGAHITVNCLDCHTNGYQGTPTDCEACHMADFNQTTNPNHLVLGLSTDCATCHTTEPNWEPAAMPNHDDFWVLDGAHLPIADNCADCHNGDYNNTPNDCAGCHIDNFNETTNPNHVNLALSTDCATCHTTEPDWMPALFPDHDDFYALNGAHAAIADDCVACHNGNYNSTPTDCYGCHEQDYTNATNPDHTALQFPTDCQTCHTESEWTPSTFDHNNYWVLDGGHLPIANDCNACHNGNYQNTPNTCDGCHLEDFNETTNPNHQNLGLATDCESCHTTEPDWMPALFPDHDNYWQLNGAHAAISNDCAACHNGDYNNTPTDCFGCHETDYNNTTNPDHQDLQFSTNCQECHTESAWTPATFDHNQFYVLDGAHALIENDCNACHNGNYNNTPNTCDGCHLDDYNSSVNPNHLNLGLSTDCESCHTTDPGWSPATFDDHDNYWVIDGGHLAVANDCAACHNGDYNNTPTTCDGCHLDDFNATTNPNHNSLGLSTDCESCHTTEPGWMPAAFPNHNNYWVIDGAHTAIENDCIECHNGNYNNTPNTCDGCHMADYNSSTDPNHVALGIPTDCESCHTTDPGWNPATFPIHNNYWVIDGAHLPIENDCAACHINGYNNTPNTCDGCHMDDFNATTNPNHPSLAIPTDCEMCHTTEPDWMPATFPIHDNYWPLNGAHAAIANDCVLCHNGNYNNTPNDCFSCHQDDYNAATNPNHLTANFPTTCEDCHSETAWIPATFDHNNIWPLTGAHIPIANDCNACHQGNYNNTPNTCEGCHMPDYNASVNPNHPTLAIPTDCAMCHTTDPDWMPALFPIHDNYYPLIGAHAAIQNDCNACHNGDYNNTPNTCFGCHEDDYNTANNPNHLSAGFPTTCEDCHTEIAWTPATFDHDGMYFPIYSGKHKDEWDQCVECHTIPGNFGVFSCIDCHEHNDPAQVADDHQGVSGYQYESNACYACHPDGEK